MMSRLPRISRKSPSFVAFAKENDLTHMMLETNLEQAVNMPDSQGNYPLYWAIWHNNYQMVVFLVEHGARLNIMKNYSETPLNYCILTRRNDIAYYLISSGASINDSDSSCHNRLPLNCAIITHDMTMAQFLISKGADLNKGSPLSDVVFHGGIHMGKFLIENGSDVMHALDSANGLVSGYMLQLLLNNWIDPYSFYNQDPKRSKAALIDRISNGIFT